MRLGDLDALKDQINATDFDFGDYYDNTAEIRKRICEVIDNAQPELFPLTVTINDKVTDEDIEILKRLMKDYKPQILNLEAERSQGKCEKCDYRKFTKTFIDGVVDVMIKNGITSVEQLSELLKGSAE